MSVKVNALDHLVINVADVARSAEWYRRILGMEVKVLDPGPGKTPRTSLLFGNQKINVRPRDADKVEWFTADHETAGSDDLCFLTASTPDQVVAHLRANGVAIAEGPVAKQGARGTLRSVYCRIPTAVSLRFRRMRMRLSNKYTAVILRSALLRASKDGRGHRASHPSRLTEEARTSG
jgi:catechol 2,3-dioxygenase-like lactoylglutathione lyase family enzyme